MFSIIFLDSFNSIFYYPTSVKASALQDPFFGVGSDVLSPRNIGSPLADNVELGSQCFAAMQTPLENFLVSCGNWENSFHVISLTDGRVVQSIRHHKDVVSCVAGMLFVSFIGLV